MDGTTVLETWSNSIRFSGAGAVQNPMEWIEEVGVPAVEQFYEWNLLSNMVYVTALKFNGINPDGRYSDQGDTNVYYWPGGDQPRGLNSSYVEPQRTLAVSWTTNMTRGRASKGRIFLPGFVVAVGQDALISAQSAGEVEVEANTFLNALSQGEYVPAIVSKAGAGAIRAITGVRVGRAVDTQRRRRRSLPESYVNVLPDDN